MMKRYFLIVLSIITFQLSFGQKDSLNYQMSYYYQTIKRSYMQTPELVKSSRLKDFTVSSLFLTGDQGNLHWGQQPTKKYDIGIKSEGIFRYKEILFFGNFLIKKEYLYNSKWNLSYMDISESIMSLHTMENPTYYGVSKGSKWSNQSYDFQGGIQFPVYTNLDLTIDGKYKLKEKFRSQFDPRVNTSYNQLTLNSSLTYSFLTKHKVFFGGSWGYFDVENDTKYSDIYQNVPFHYESYQKWIAGYGTLLNRTDDNTKRRNEHYILKTGYSLRDNKNDFLATFNFKKHKTDNFKNNVTRAKLKDIISTYESDQYQINFLLDRKLTSNKNIVFNLTGNYLTGDNILNFQKGVNYSLKKQNYSIGIGYINYNDENYNNIGLNISYLALHQEDFLSKTISNIKNLVFNTYYTSNFKLNKLSITPFIDISYKYNLKGVLKNENINYKENYDELDFAGKTLKLLYDEVIYHDYNVSVMPLGKLKFGTQFSFPMKKMNLSIDISQSYTSDFQRKSRYLTQMALNIQY